MEDFLFSFASIQPKLVNGVDVINELNTDLFLSFFFFYYQHVSSSLS